MVSPPLGPPPGLPPPNEATDEQLRIRAREIQRRKEKPDYVRYKSNASGRHMTPDINGSKRNWEMRAAKWRAAIREWIESEQQQQQQQQQPEAVSNNGVEDTNVQH